MELEDVKEYINKLKDLSEEEIKIIHRLIDNHEDELDLMIDPYNDDPEEYSTISIMGDDIFHLEFTISSFEGELELIHYEIF